VAETGLATESNCDVVKAGLNPKSNCKVSRDRAGHRI
jgi:hypothetical protein